MDVRDFAYPTAKSSEFMTMDSEWRNLHLKLTRNGKIEKAAIVDKSGKIVACSPDFSLKDSDINTLNCALAGQYSSLVKITFGKGVFTCFRQCEENDTLLGKNEDEILVAHRQNGFLVVGIGYSDTPGSCLYEVTHFAKRFKSKRFSCKIVS